MKICIDAGHGLANVLPGRYDSGAVYAGVFESHVVLDWALAGRFLAIPRGIDVWLTRSVDWEAAPLRQRVRRAVAEGCTHFLSLHCNSAAGAKASGVETSFRDSGDRDFAALVQRCGLEAMSVPSRLARDHGLKSEQQSQHQRLTVLDFGGPSALLEIGFLTNSFDRNRMMEREARMTFWNSLFDALSK